MTIQYRGFLIARDTEPHDRYFPWMYARPRRGGPEGWAHTIRLAKAEIDLILAREHTRAFPHGKGERMKTPLRDAVMVDCPGLLDGRYLHAMRDGCSSCAPFWERIPTCPDDGTRLTPNGYCRMCRRHFRIVASQP